MIPPEIATLLEPLERFEAIRRKVVRLGPHLADLSYANPYDGVAEVALSALRDTLAEDRALGLQYAPFGGKTLARRAVADALTTSHGMAFAFDDVVLTPGAMSALQLACQATGLPGQEIVIPVPCWLDYPVYARHAGRVPVTVPLRQGDFALDIDAVAAAITPSTCAVVLAHPSNPTGRNYARKELEALAAVIREREEQLGCEITVIADEAHRDFTEPGAYASLAQFFDRTLILYSFGKYHFMQGQRLGYVATSPRHPDGRAVASELVRWTRVSGTATPTALMQRAAPRLLAISHDHRMIKKRRAQVREDLVDAGYEVVPSDATMFLYVRTPPGRDDYEFLHEVAVKGLLTLPAPVFHHTGYFRISLTASEEMLEKAMETLQAVS